MDVVMPRLGDTMEDGTILAWHKHVGDAVQTGEVLCEVETDKSTVDLEAEASGILTAVYAADGTTVPIGTVIARIE